MIDRFLVDYGPAALERQTGVTGPSFSLCKPWSQPPTSRLFSAEVSFSKAVACSEASVRRLRAPVSVTQPRFRRHRKPAFVTEPIDLMGN